MIATAQRQRLSLALVGALLVVACGEPSPTDEPRLPVGSGELAPAARPVTQDRALESRLHRVHLDGATDGQCRTCHTIAGRPGKVGDSHRCTSCHGEHASTVHAGVADGRAKECLSCHDFLAETADPWACGVCHEASAIPMARADLALPEAPKVLIHAKSGCGSCHSPHGPKALDPKPCTDCHDDQKAKHHPGLSGPDQCLECHASGHVPARKAQTTCASCHTKDVAETWRIGGHEACTTCHLPHEASGRKACASCHESQPTAGAKVAVEHARCESCHLPHRVSEAPAKACTTCHEQVHPDHPVDERGRGACAGCHPPHLVNGELFRAVGCTVCHEVSRTETGFHGGTRCDACHADHRTRLSKEDGALCGGCHGASAAAGGNGRARPEGAVVAPTTGHDKCIDCHTSGPHEPRKEIAACASCHEAVRDHLTPGHDKCLDCHTAHEGRVEKTCVDCHDDKVGRRHATDRGDCTTCHRSHGPKGPSKPKACATCHDEPLPLLHGQKGHETCDDCHAFHESVPARRDRDRCLGACHADLGRHEPEATSCIGCHPFEKAGQTPAPVPARPGP